MMGNALVSVIIPVYNVEKYLGVCIESVVAQTYKNLEIVIIDDGSKDNSGNIIDEWSMKDSRIVVVHKENGGVSDARNIALNLARGEYFLFVDSDDYIASNCVELLLRCMIEEKADIAMCKYFTLWQDACNKDARLPMEKMIMTSDDYMNLFYTYSGHYSVLWNKMYRRHIFENVVFEKGRVNEDAIIMPRLLSAATRIAHTPEALYYYRQRKESIMNGRRYDGILKSEILWITEHTQYYAEIGNEHLLRMAQKLMYNKILEYYNFLNKKKKKEMKKKLFALQKELVTYFGFSLKIRVKIFVTAYVPAIYGKYYRRKFSKNTEHKAFD